MFCGHRKCFAVQWEATGSSRRARTGIARQHIQVDGKLHELKRDVAKYWKHNNIRIALVGLENQIETDKYMPIRVMSYDATAYRQQFLNQYETDPETGKQVRKKNAEPIYPVVTMVLYFGNIPWKNTGLC